MNVVHTRPIVRIARGYAAPDGRDWEIRAFFRDPDGHLLGISEAGVRS